LPTLVTGDDGEENAGDGHGERDSRGLSGFRQGLNPTILQRETQKARPFYKIRKLFLRHKMGKLFETFVEQIDCID